MSERASSPASFVHCLLDTLASDGHDVDKVLSQLNIDPLTLQTPKARVATEQFTPLWELVYKTHGPASGLVVGQRIKLVDLQDLGLYLATTENTGELIQQMCHYMALSNDILDLRVNPTFQGLRIELRYTMEVPYLYERLEAVVMACISLIEQYSGKPLSFSQLELIRPAPKKPNTWDEAFGVKVSWAASTTSGIVGHRETARVLATRNPGLKQMLGSILSMRLRKLTARDPLSKVRAVMSEQMAEAPTVDSVASALHTGKRSLQRTLSREGTSFNTLLTEVRESMAKDLLTGGMPVYEVVEALGYSSQAAFQRAFKQWTGMTPAEFAAKSRKTT